MLTRRTVRKVGCHAVALGATLVLLALTACEGSRTGPGAEDQPPRLTRSVDPTARPTRSVYQPPQPMATLPITERTVPSPTASVLSNLTAHLEAAARKLVDDSLRYKEVPDLLFVQPDDAARRITVTYIGEPGRFIDCGRVSWPPGSADGSLEPATEQVLRSNVGYSRYGAPFERTMRLDARLVLSVEPELEGSQVTTSTSYVMTKAVATLAADGRIEGAEVETISFAPHETGRFWRGTECRATGELERMALAPL